MDITIELRIRHPAIVQAQNHDAIHRIDFTQSIRRGELFWLSQDLKKVGLNFLTLVEFY